MSAREWRFDELQVGQIATFRHRVSDTDLDDFARVSGDKNPLHVDRAFALEQKFQDRVAHGIFLGALISRLVGMELPGLHALLLTVQLDFKKPVYADDELSVEGKIQHKSESTKIIDMHVSIQRNKELVTEGVVQVRVLR